MNKLIKLVAIASLSGLLTSNCHYLLSFLNADNLKILLYGSILIIAIMGIILDENFNEYFGNNSQGIVAILASCFTAIFLIGSLRAYALQNTLEGLVLSLFLGVFWVILLAIYIKLIIGVRQ